MPKRRLNSLFIFALGMLMCMTVALAPLPSFAAEETEGKTVIEAEKEAVKPAHEADKSFETSMKMVLPGKAHEGKEAEENVGFPQLNAKTYPSQLFWLFVTFALLYVLMSKLALPKVGAVLDARQSHKEGDLKRAAQLQEEATKVKAAYEAAIAKAQAEAQEAQAAAEQEISEKIAAENAKFTEAARKRVATAEQNIARAKDDAVASLADISADVAAEMVNKIAGVQINKAEAKKAVTTVMQKEVA
ncbi:MAG: ATPase [Alphaproteobacteria bacterium]|nr:MAG: ATPase [Alphaproteobacteria bacterium]